MQETKAETESPTIGNAKSIANILSPTWPPRCSNNYIGATDRKMAWRTCGIGKRHRKNMVENPTGEWGRTLDRLTGIIGSGVMIGLCGNRGTGKTQLAAHLIRERLRRYDPDIVRGSGAPPRYCRAMEIFLDVRACFKTAASVSERDAIRGYISPCMLVIDEMQERGETAFEDRLLTYIIEVRYAEMRDTIIISNQTPAEFSKQIGVSAASRMREAGGMVECKWESFRNNKPVQAYEQTAIERRMELKNENVAGQTSAARKG